MPESVLFRVQAVRVRLSPEDLPGPSRRKVACARCGQVVRDGREVVRDGKPLCRPCAEGVYFANPREIAWEGMGAAPGDPSEPGCPHGHGHHVENKGRRCAAVIALRRN
jgi:formylmethanofuran dehydrogenase subunit E